jgi:hypothetical protein
MIRNDFILKLISRCRFTPKGYNQNEFVYLYCQILLMSANSLKNFKKKSGPTTSPFLAIYNHFLHFLWSKYFTTFGIPENKFYYMPFLALYIYYMPFLVNI